MYLSGHCCRKTLFQVLRTMKAFGGEILSKKNRELQRALNLGQIVIHPWIITELALGSLRDRTKTLALLDLLPQVRVARMGELRLMIEARHLLQPRHRFDRRAPDRFGPS